MFEIEEWSSISQQEDELVHSLFGKFSTGSKKQKSKRHHSPRREISPSSSTEKVKGNKIEKIEELVSGDHQSPSGKKKKKRKKDADAMLPGFEKEQARAMKKRDKAESLSRQVQMSRDKIQERSTREDDGSLPTKLKSSKTQKKKWKGSVSDEKAVESKGDEQMDKLQATKLEEFQETHPKRKKKKGEIPKKAKRKRGQEERSDHSEDDGGFELQDSQMGSGILGEKLKREMLKFKKSNIKDTCNNESTDAEDRQVRTKDSTCTPTNKPTPTSSSKSVFQQKMMRKLESSRFRWINEQLYTTKGCEAMQMFSGDPSLFGIYHRGFTAQVQHWPINPVDVIIEWLKERPSSLVVADFGCGEAIIAQKVPNKVHSFDLVAVNEQVTACDMSKVPLPDSSVDIAVFCLSLMGTNLVDYLQEAHRVLRPGGILQIAEVVSRIENIDAFVASLSKLGFQIQNTDTSNKMFVIFELLKSGTIKQKSLKTGLKGLQLKPCIYKRR